MSSVEPTWCTSAAGGAANGLNWLARAEGLYRAFKILREVWESDMASLPIRVARTFRGEHEESPESVGPSAMLLAAFTMENLLKGLVVVREPGSVQPRATDPERLLDWGGNGHDLLALARRAGERLSAEEEDLMRLLTEFALWAGRYPVSLRAKAMRPRPGAEGGGAAFRGDHLTAVDVPFNRLRRTLFWETRERQLEPERIRRELHAPYVGELFRVKE